MDREPGHEEKLWILDHPCTEHWHKSDSHLVALPGPEEGHLCLFGQISRAKPVSGNAAMRASMCHMMSDAGSQRILASRHHKAVVKVKVIQ